MSPCAALSLPFAPPGKVLRCGLVHTSLLAYISTFTVLLPGDVVLTHTIRLTA